VLPHLNNNTQGVVWVVVCHLVNGLNTVTVRCLSLFTFLPAFRSPVVLERLTVLAVIHFNATNELSGCGVVTVTRLAR